jgi:hypothetical protein
LRGNLVPRLFPPFEEKGKRGNSWELLKKREEPGNEVACEVDSIEVSNFTKA